MDRTRDEKTQRALHLERPKTLTSELATALAYEAAKEASHAYAKL